MPFLSQKDSRERLQTAQPFNFTGVPTFGETFNASLGMVIDESLSVSRMLNREGLQERNRQIDDFIFSGSESTEGFTDVNGRFDYGKFAEIRKVEGIKTDKELRTERNKILADRRTYAQDVLEHGSGMAQFLGAANAYILDPINIATMGYSGAVVSAKSLSILGRSLMTARNLAGAGAATELMIQPLVYQHKQDIESPFAVEDAIIAIATTALGAGLLGGVGGGISGYLKSTREATIETAIGRPSNVEKFKELNKTFEEAKKKAEKSNQKAQEAFDRGDRAEGERLLDLNAIDRANVQAIDVELNKLTGGSLKPEVVTALESVERLETTLKAAPVADLDAIERQFLLDIRAELTATAGNRLTRGERKELEAVSLQIRQRVNKVVVDEAADVPLVKKKGVPARKAKALNLKAKAAAVEAEEAAARTEVGSLQEVSDRALSRLEADRLAIAAEADLSRLEQGILTDANKKELLQVQQKAVIDTEANYLREYEQHRVESNQPSVKPENYVEPEQPKAPTAKATPMQRQALQNNEITEAYNRDMAKYDALDDVQKGEAIAEMKALDDELEGLESVVVCAIA